ncbi:vWA domain-containing protein [Capnocytophaga cynodegmi]|uniref:von Willebrand factor type A domain protein n=1 Tax=Capnocytophaga cynodegmi TaxID=28189 RepID=A0A0B7HHB2_9FLAO|nr:VWA domain-containing protein [Capnocytophaga cynodegmi]CEN34340.1 von Willebrand factor type A domain protein [Capnocytophaga cynodegmi]CEN38059.1 von Willebrand factor type A domain protein [Capnocytophaga cynodegmi]
MIHIDEKIYLWFIPIIAFMFLVFVFSQIRKRRKQKHFADEKLLKRLAPNRSSFKPWLKFSFLAVIIVLLCIALANPKIGTKIETVKREGVDVVFAIDVSKSMLAEDVAPNRLEKAKRLVFETMSQLKGDRIGIVAYAASAYPQLPLTTDHSAAKMFLQSMNTDMLSSQGTAIQEAIRMGSNYFDENLPTSRILVIISDGEDHEMGATEIATEALNQGITIYTVGVGSQKGAPIPIKEGNTQTYKRDRNGEVVITHLNRELLEQIAQNAGGKYINGDNTKEAVEEIVKILDRTEKSEFETQKFVDYKDQFQWFLAGALLLLILDFFIFERKTLWVKKLNLFNES